MSPRAPVVATFICAALLLAAGASAQSAAGSPAQSSTPAAAPSQPFTTGRPPPVGELKSLGKDRYQVGRIVVDKKAGRFTVPGRVLVMGQPLEYLATSPKGMKDYETLLEADAGPKVLVSIAWQDGGKRREISAAEALLDPKGDVRPESVEWVYTGSLSMPPDGQFAADITGTLIGFVHDANSIIESVLGLGIGAYGSVSGNADLLPPVGTPIELVVQLARAQAKPAGP